MLVVAEFGGRLALKNAVWNHRRDGVAVFGKFVDQRFRHVFNRGKTAGHVAVQRRVAHRHLALVAGGEKNFSALVGQRHQQHAAAPGL